MEHQGLRRRGQEVLRRAEEAELPEGRGLPEVPQDLRPDRGGHRSSASSSTCSRTRSATRSSRARTRSPTRQIADYYNKNKTRFAQPEQRDLRVVLTKTKAKADKAKAALERGESWKAVAKKYSIDEASKAQGGKLPARRQGPAGEGARRRRLHRQEGRARRPGQDAVRLLRLRGHQDHAASQQTLERGQGDDQADCSQSQNQQKALDTFVKDFPKSWKDKTECPEGYVTRTARTARRPRRPRRPPPRTRRSRPRRTDAEATGRPTAAASGAGR